MRKEATKQFKTGMASAIPMGQWGSPDEIAKAASSSPRMTAALVQRMGSSLAYALLSSGFSRLDDAAWLTGERINASGGLR